MDWLKGGDQHAASFKAKASKRKDKKYIEVVLKEDGTEIYDSQGIMTEFVNYFKILFSCSPTIIMRRDWNEMMILVQPTISDEMNSKLNEPYSMEEIKSELHSSKCIWIKHRD